MLLMVDETRCPFYVISSFFGGYIKGKIQKLLLIYILFYVGFHIIRMHAYYYKITIYITAQTAKKRQNSLVLLILQNTIDDNNS
jgi:hypothetical protein